jgi:RimJ/RimL family protein N-acetyltransferase
MVRPFTHDDLHAAFTLLDGDTPDAQKAEALEKRKRWLDWTVLNYEQLAALYQPPYGDRAVCLLETGELIGAVGLVPCLEPFAQFSTLAKTKTRRQKAGQTTAEVGLFWQIRPEHRNKGYATEAARLLVGWAFWHLNLARIVASTDSSNLASQAVMRHLGMTVELRPRPSPHGWDVCGVVTRAQFNAHIETL